MRKSRFFVALVLILSLLMSTVLCGSTSQSTVKKAVNGTEKALINLQTATTIGNTLKLGATVVIPKNTFDQNVTLTLNTLSTAANANMKSSVFSILGQPISVAIDGKKAVRLNQPASIQIAVPPKQLSTVKNKDDIYAAYFNGSKWEYFLPDSIDTKTGIVKFKTYHFSDYGIGTLSEKEQIERFASQMAVQNWAKNISEQGFIDATASYFNQAFEKMGISDKSAQGKLLRNIVKENDFGSLLVSMERNDTVEFGTKLGEMTGKAILNMHQLDPDFMSNSTTVVSTASKAAGYIAGGDYTAAQKEIALGMMDFFPSGRALKAAVEVIDTGIQNWTDSEIESAYQAYKNGAVNQRGYNVTKGRFDELIVQMKGISAKMYRDAILAYCAKEGVKESSLSKSTLAQIRNAAETSMKNRFDKRLTAETNIQTQKEAHKKTIAAFKRLHLLDRGSLGFAAGDNIEDRLRRLYVVKENIQALIGKEIPIDDMCILIGVWYTDKSKNRAAFFAKLKSMGYQKEATAISNEYAWHFAKIIDKDNKEAWTKKQKFETFAYEVSYAPGAYTVNQIYNGKSDNYYNPPYVHGEALSIQAQWSSPPKIIKNGDTVSLTVSIAPLSNTLSAFKFSGSTRAFLGGSNMTNAAGKYHFEISSKNNYAAFKDTVTAKVGGGSKDGDKLEINLSFFTSELMETIYVYEWRKGK
jgi:hypothetical protein